MTLKLKPASEQVIVVTGASSGIGLATAQMAAQQGASVVLAARTKDALDQAVQEITTSGGTALAVVADVGRREDLERVASQAVERFGRIDTWVNNAGVGIWGRIEEVSLADMRQLFDTNFWGQVHGSLVALPHLKANGGALINVGSMASDRAIPLQGIYSASKHAVKGFTDALRAEVEAEGAPVSITLIKPGSIGTPLPQHVKNYTDHEAKLPPPVYEPEEVARAILRAATQPVRDVTVGSAARVISTASKLAPRVVDLVSEKLAPVQLGPKPPTPSDNLWKGRSEAKVRGDTQGSTMRPSLYTRAAAHPALATAAAGAAGAAVAGVGYILSRRRSAARLRQAEAEEPLVLETRLFEAVVVLDDEGADSSQFDSDLADGTSEDPTISQEENGLASDDDAAQDTAFSAEEEIFSADLEAFAPEDPSLGDLEADTSASADDLVSDESISDGPNARPRDETISQTGPGLPDDTSEPVEITPEEEARIAEKIRAL